MITSVLAVAQKNGERHDCPQSVGKVDVLGRLRYDPRTRAYAERRTHEGLSKPEIIRCLKRYVAREIFNALPILVAENTSTHPLAKPQEHPLSTGERQAAQ